MIDQLDVNHKVGILKFAISNDNPFDSELLAKMAKNYRNVYHIYILDRCNYLKSEIHDQLR